MMHSVLLALLVSVLFTAGVAAESAESHESLAWGTPSCPYVVTKAKKDQRDALLVKFFDAHAQALSAPRNSTALKSILSQNATLSINVNLKFEGNEEIATNIVGLGGFLGITGIKYTPVPAMIKNNAETKDTEFYVELVFTYTFMGTNDDRPLESPQIYFFRSNKDLTKIVEARLYFDFGTLTTVARDRAAAARGWAAFSFA